MNKNNPYEKIEEISSALGISDNERTIFEIIQCDDPKQRSLNLKSGSWGGVEPWFGIDENRDLHTMVSIKTLSELIDAYRDSEKENFDLRLEKTIWQNVPIDFADVWVVATQEIARISQNEQEKKQEIDLEMLIKNIKRDHPNLFVDIKQVLKFAKESIQ